MFIGNVNEDAHSKCWLGKDWNNVAPHGNGAFEVCADAVEEKEIKALFNKDITFERYQREFDDVGAETFFESSPPYSHRGLAAYKTCWTLIQNYLLKISIC